MFTIAGNCGRASEWVYFFEDYLVSTNYNHANIQFGTMANMIDFLKKLNQPKIIIIDIKQYLYLLLLSCSYLFNFYTCPRNASSMVIFWQLPFIKLILFQCNYHSYNKQILSVPIKAILIKIMTRIVVMETNHKWSLLIYSIRFTLSTRV